MLNSRVISCRIMIICLLTDNLVVALYLQFKRRNAPKC